MTHEIELQQDASWYAHNDNQLREKRKEECINKIDDLEIDLQAAYRDANGDWISRIEEEIAELEEEIDRLTPYIPPRNQT